MIEEKSIVLIKDTKETGEVKVVTSDGTCTIILEDSNCCRRRKINDLEEIFKGGNVCILRQETIAIAEFTE